MASDSEIPPDDGGVRRRSTYTPPSARVAESSAASAESPTDTGLGYHSSVGMPPVTDPGAGSIEKTPVRTSRESTLDAIERLQATIAQRQAERQALGQLDTGWSWTADPVAPPPAAATPAKEPTPESEPVAATEWPPPVQQADPVSEPPRTAPALPPQFDAPPAYPPPVAPTPVAPTPEPVASTPPVIEVPPLTDDPPSSYLHLMQPPAEQADWPQPSAEPAAEPPSVPAWPWVAAPPEATAVSSPLAAEPPPVTGALPWQAPVLDFPPPDAAQQSVAPPPPSGMAPALDFPPPTGAPLATEAPTTGADTGVTEPAPAPDPIQIAAPPALVEPEAPASTPVDAAWLSSAGVIPSDESTPLSERMPDDLPPSALAAGALTGPTLARAADGAPPVVATTDASDTALAAPERSLFDGAPTTADPNVWLPEEVAPAGAWPPPLEQELEAKDGVSHLFGDLGEPGRPAPGMFSLEIAGAEPTPLEQRLGRSTRLFWMWFPVAASVISVGLGGVLFATGLSFRQSVIAVLVGVALSALPIALTTLAGKWSGQPTLVVSRATFGLVGNAFPSLVGLASRVFWAAALLWVLASAVAHTVLATGATVLDEQQLMLIGLTGGLIVTALIAYVGHHLLRRLQVAFGVLALIATVGMIALTWPSVDLTAALAVPDGSWFGVLTGASLVFAVLGVTLGHAGSDLARYQRPSSSGAWGMSFATAASVLPALVLFSYGALLSASDPVLGAQLATDPLGAVAAALPPGFGIPLLVAAGIPLVSGISVALYSAGFGVLAMGLRTSRTTATLIAVLLLVSTIALLVLAQVDFSTLILDIAVPLAVPMAAWSGIFVGDMMIRTRRFDAKGLLQLGGSYPAVRWVNLIWWVLLTVAGFGLLTSTLPWLAWTGYLLPFIEPLGIPDVTLLASGGAVVSVVLILGWVWPFITGIPTVRKQEQHRRLTAGAEHPVEARLTE